MKKRCVWNITRNWRSYVRNCRPPWMGWLLLAVTVSQTSVFLMTWTILRNTGQTKIQVKMEKLSSTTKGICELENYHYGEETKRPPLFHTWPTTHFYEVSHKLLEMYRKELLLKRTVAKELAHTRDPDLTLSYLSMWLHQPYVESDSRLHLESMLLETGHRAL
ncbi:cyclin-dependent kinase 2-interacting protein isoform X3 [Macaca fascicularis]|uniref:cyclin-dependent kinase 2-interacting protein isoform X3 n=1 Tax=Macaca fascicularis TaxID=9541 RepID=UPI003D159397